MIPQETIDKIFETVQIQEVVSDFVELKKAGANYKGRCPFHNEKTPSFVVSPTKGIYKCFGCGKGGNSIMFLQELQSITYPEALRYVAEKYNIEIIEEKLTAEEETKQSEKESLFIATKFASNYFQDILWNTEEGKLVGLSYFKERGFSEEIIKKFKLGYSPKKQNSFEDSALKAGYDKKVLISSSLIGENSQGKTYDKFRDRVIFPIHSYSGKEVGFGARAFNAEAKAKYLNSGESLIYDKSKVLYGLYASKQAISKSNKCYVVEGYTDVISMHQNGIENVISASGTALSIYQIQLIKRSTNNIVLLFDRDQAGEKAVIRSINLCLKVEMNVKVVSFPEGEDPDSYSKKLTTKSFQEYLDKSAVNFVDYLIWTYKLKEEKDAEKIIEIKKKIIFSISEMPDIFNREEYCKIYHGKLGLSEEALLQQVSRARAKDNSSSERKWQPKKEETQSKNTKNNTLTEQLKSQEKEVLRLLINYGNERFINMEKEEESVAGMIISELYQDEIKFSVPQHQNLYLEIIQLIKDTAKIDVQKLITHSNKEISKQTIDLVAQAHYISRNWKDQHNIITGREDEKMQKTTEKAILSLKRGIVAVQISTIQKKLKADPNDQKGIKKLTDLTKIKTEISKLLGRNVG
tara:strand:+ start:2149 stop:4053 length:1905 start_codon:yes stop_codon:yes gene_type:complete